MEMSRAEAAAILGEFQNPVAVDDAHSEMVGQMPEQQMKRRMMAERMANIPEPVKDRRTVPQSGVGVPDARPFGTGMTGFDAMCGDSEMMFPGGGRGGNISVYEDNGQKFMIKEGCIYKQTWTTIENGGECRMFNTRTGKKVQPKGIVIQKYDWVPLSVATSLGDGRTRTRPTRKRIEKPVEPEQFHEPVDSKPDTDLDSNAITVKPERDGKKIIVKNDENGKHVEVTTVSNTNTQERKKTPSQVKKSPPKTTHNAGILRNRIEK